MKKTVRAALAAILALSLLSACTGGEPPKQVDLAEFAKTLQEEYEFASYLMELDPEGEDEYAQILLEQNYADLLELDLEQRVLLVTMISINNGEIDLVQAKDADGAAKAAEIFQARIDYMAGDGETPGGAFYPGPTMLWTNSAQVVVNGNYVMLVCGDDYEQIAADFNALFE